MNEGQVSRLTFVTACAPYHRELLSRAAASVQAQTIPCAHVVIHDEEGKGPGHARNAGLAQVQSPFVVFLDADDWVEPQFAELTLAAYQPGRYVYTDIRRDGHGVEAPDCPWVQGRWHVVTTLLATEDVRRVGGFDETLIAAEDTDLFHKLTRSGVCGIRVKAPLFHYGSEGQRGRNFVLSGQYWPTLQLIQERYRSLPMGCCGEEGSLPIPPQGEQRDGDVLAQAMYAGNRTQRGLATGRMYPRISYPRTAWVDPRDVQASPNVWRVGNGAEAILPQARTMVSVPRPQAVMNTANGVQDVAARLFGTAPTPPAPAGPVERAPVQPDVGYVIETAKRALGG